MTIYSILTGLPDAANSKKKKMEQLRSHSVTQAVYEVIYMLKLSTLRQKDLIFAILTSISSFTNRMNNFRNISSFRKGTPIFIAYQS